MENNKGIKPNNDNQGLPNNGGNGKARFIIYIVILAVLIGITFIDFGSNANEINWNKFENEMLLTNDVEKVVVVNRERADIYIKPESLDKFGAASRGSSIFSGAMPTFYFNIGDVESFEAKLAEAQKDMPKEQRVSARLRIGSVGSGRGGKLGGSSIEQRLRQLEKLRRKSLVSEEEYNSTRNRILAEI